MELLRIVDNLSGALSLADVRAKADDFFIDRLSYQFTSAILCGFALLCGIRSSYAVPMICWIPAQLRRYEKTITAYCYANNTYYVPDNRRVPTTADERYQSLIFYYQWLPWILGVQAILFYMPKLVWQLALSGSRHNVQALLDAATKLYILPDFQKQKVVPAKFRKEQLVYINAHLFDAEDIEIVHSGPRRKGQPLSCYFIICYLAVKFLYLINCSLQIGLIHQVIGTRPFGVSYQNSSQTHFFTQFTHKISSGISELIDTSSFPKRTICDFTFRELASNHAYTVECILPLNIIVEKMYVFLYLWFILLAIITSLDFIKWIIHLIHCLVSSDHTRDRYVRTHLLDRTKYKAEDIKLFANKHLSGNTYFIMKLFSKNISTFIVVDMLDYYFHVKANKNKNE